MKDDDALVIGGLALLVMLGSKRAPIPWGVGWSWPVPPVTFADGATYPPEVSQEWKPGHFGVDIVYRRRSLTDRPMFPAGSVNGSTMHFAPPGTPILAAKDARVWSVAKTPRGWAVVLDHGAPFATFYQHLERVDLEPHAGGLPLSSKVPTLVKAGDMLGTMGFDPTDPQRLRHLHFAVWYKGSGDNASVDPADVMRSWRKAPPWKP